MAIVNETDKIRQINVTLEPSKTIDVNFYKSSRADITMSCTYIKSGQQEIQNYTNNVCKPDMDNYIINKVEKTLQPMLNEAKASAQSAKASAYECANVVAGLNMENIIAVEAYNRTEADQALENALDDAYQELDTKISAKANQSAVYSKTESDLLFSAKADLTSPQFTGTPTVPTAAEGASEQQIANLAAVKSNISKLLSTNGLYYTITTTASQWCREWFSDKAKTQRVWMEQGGELVKNNNSGVNQYIITFLVPYTNTKYHFERSQEHFYEGTISTCRAWNGYQSKSTTGIKYIIDNNYAVTSTWYSCGQ